MLGQNLSYIREKLHFLGHARHDEARVTPSVHSAGAPGACFRHSTLAAFSPRLQRGGRQQRAGGARVHHLILGAPCRMLRARPWRFNFQGVRFGCAQPAHAAALQIEHNQSPDAIHFTHSSLFCFLFLLLFTPQRETGSWGLQTTRIHPQCALSPRE